METREKSKKNAAELNENDEESRTTEVNANEKDGGRQRGCKNTKGEHGADSAGNPRVQKIKQSTAGQNKR